MKKLLLMFLSSLLFFACSDESLLDDKTNSAFELSARSNKGKSVKFKVSITNISDDIPFPKPFAPGVWVVQKQKSVTLFEDGHADFGDGLEALAEDGMVNILDHSLNNHPKVRSKGVFTNPVGQSSPAPIFHGDSYEFEFSAKPNDHLNLATMFIQSNDLFVAPGENGIPLFNHYGDAISGDITGYFDLWDAGTEVNEQPGVGPNQAPRQPAANTGTVENGVVQRVNDGYHYPAITEMLHISITPM